MSKRKYLTFFTLVFAIVALFAASDAMAFWNDPVYGLDWETTICKNSPDCFAPTSPYEETIGDWTVRYLGFTEIDNTDPKRFRHHYEIFKVKNGSETASGLNLAAWLLPVCWGNSPQVLISLGESFPDNLKLESQAVGVPSGGFGRQIQDTFVLWGTPVADSIGWDLASRTNKVTWSTVYVDARRTSGLGFKMPVPGCDLAPEPPCEPAPGGITSSYRECRNNLGKTNVQGDEIHYWYYRNSDAQGCIDQEKDFIICTGFCPEKYDDESGTCTPPLTPSQVAEHILASSLNPQKCDDEAVNTTFNIGDHYLYEVWSGGYYWSGCLNLDTYVWDPLYCCSAPNACP